MAKKPFMSALVLVFVTVTAGAQGGESRIDAGHSTASLSLVSSSSGVSWNVGIARVSGTLTLNDNPREDAFNLNIYPAHQGSLLLNQSGEFKSNSFADLARYTMMSFRSSSVTRNADGKLVVTGRLSVTYVYRPAEIEWSNAYTGPEYGAPVAQTRTGEVTFVLGPEKATTATTNSTSPGEMSGLATIDLRSFPELRAAWLKSVWPIVVEDEHCEMPQVRGGSMRDYTGAICTGTPVVVTPLGPLAPVGEDYPRQDGVTTPASDKATILVHLRLEGVR